MKTLAMITHWTQTRTMTCVDFMDENDNWRAVFLLSETEC
jgi:hypothetical protein